MNTLADLYQGFVVDLDGTLILDNSLIKGAKPTLNKLLKAGKDVIIVSNKTIETPDDYYNFFLDKGINIPREKIITSSEVLKKYLYSNFANKNFFAIGEKPFINFLDNEAVKYSEDPNNIDVVIVTLDRTFEDWKIEIAAKALKNGARFFAANIDDTCPVKRGEISDAGTIIPLLENESGRRLEKHFGKPSKFMFNEIKAKMGFKLSDYLIIGDRLQTDIRMGNIFKVDTALVRTGVKNYFEIFNDAKPTYKIESIGSLFEEVLY